MLGARADEGGATIRKALMAVPMDSSVDLSFDLTLSLPQQDVTKPQRSWVGVGVLVDLTLQVDLHCLDPRYLH